MPIIRFLKQRLGLLVLAGGVMAVSSQASSAEAQWNYSAWHAGVIEFGSPNTWDAVPWHFTAANPDQGRAYFCENFGFFNCQVPAPANTWLASAVQCWSGAIGSSSSQIFYSAWSQTIPTANCTAGFPNAGTVWVQVASIPYSNWTYH